MARNEGIYALALRRDVPHPFPPESDEVTVEADEKEDEKKEEKPGKKPAGYIRIDLDGLAERVARVPVPFEDYNGLYAVDGKLVYTKLPAFYLGRESEP